MRKLLLVIGLIAAMICAGWTYSTVNAYRATSENRQFNEDIDNLFNALQKYKERAGTYPVGNNADIVKCLQGNNPKNIIVVVGRKLDVNTKGELVDRWGTPYRIYFTGDSVLIRSAGPNKRFDDSSVQNPDDYYKSN